MQPVSEQKSRSRRIYAMISQARRAVVRTRTLGLLSMATLGAILVAGLWPFHAPRNEVTWLGNGSGLHFGDFGTVLSSGALRRATSQDQSSCSLEIWLDPGFTYDTNTFLAFYTRHRPLLFSLHQSNLDLELRRNIGDLRHEDRRERLYVDDVFQKGKPVFITLTSGPTGIAIYINGALARKSRDFPLSADDLTGQLVVGDSPIGTDSWSGNLLGLAVYHRELTASQVLENYENWTTAGRPAAGENESSTAVYLFDEHTGRVVHNLVSSGVDLHIPQQYMVVDQIFLQLPWNEFHSDWGYWKDVLINIGGFIPFGFFVCAYLSSAGKIERPALTTVFLGGILSLMIETLQAYLPNRQSGMTDVITNTAGTCLGVALVHFRAVQALHRATMHVFSRRRRVDDQIARVEQ